MIPEQFATELNWFFAASHRAKSCSSKQISELENRHELALPEDYKRFLAKAVRGAKDFWRGSDYTFDQFDDMQEGTHELLVSASLFLPQSAFVCFMHQGYQFYLVCPDGVYFFLEGETQYVNRHDSFAAFFLAPCKTF